MAQDGVEDKEEFVHAGGQGDFLGFAGGAEALVEGANGRVVPGGDERGHVQGGAHAGAAPPDDTPAAQRAALAGERGHANQGGNGFAVEVAEFGHLGEQGQGGGRANAGDAAQQILPFAPERAGLHGVAQVVVEGGELVVQPGDVRLDTRAHGRQGGIEPVALGRAHADKLTPSGQQGAEFLGLGVRERAWRRLHDLGEAREQLGVQGVGLGQLADGAGEIAHLARVNHRHGEPGRRQRGSHRQLAPARRLQDDEGGAQRPQPRGERGDAVGSVRIRNAIGL